MKNLLLASALIAVLAQTFSSLGILAGFQINRNFIAASLCVNRTKPELHCNGKCYLNKELLKNEKQNSHPSQVPSKVTIEPLQFTGDACSLVFFKQPLIAVIPVLTSTFSAESFSRSVFHPPRS